MAKSKNWHGVPRSEVSWYPIIDYSKCTSCGVCLLSCGSGVFAFVAKDGTYRVQSPQSCVIGCTTCQRLCPEDAISFPANAKSVVKNLIIKYKIFPEVKNELQERLSKFPDHIVDASSTVEK